MPDFRVDGISPLAVGARRRLTTAPTNADASSEASRVNVCGRVGAPRRNARVPAGRRKRKGWRASGLGFVSLGAALRLRHASFGANGSKRRRQAPSLVSHDVRYASLASRITPAADARIASVPTRATPPWVTTASRPTPLTASQPRNDRRSGGRQSRAYRSRRAGSLDADAHGSLTTLVRPEKNRENRKPLRSC